MVSLALQMIQWCLQIPHARAQRVCSDRFSYISAPIGAFGAQINQPAVARAWIVAF
jgi:hypothetical protein